MQAKVKHLIGLALRLLICAGLLAYLFRQTDFRVLAQALAQTLAHWLLLLTGLLLTLLGLLTCVLRWKKLLDAQGIRFSNWKVFLIFFIGQFFNSFMLGGCGGDMARAYYAARGLEGKRAEAAATVFMDRAVGLFTMIVFCCVMILFQIRIFLDNEGPRDTGVLMVIFLLLALFAIAALYEKNVFEHFALFQRLENNTRLGPLIRRAYNAFFLYRSHPRIMCVAVLLSVLNLVFLTFACYCFGLALGIAIPPVHYFTLFPIISVLSAIPITPGALGVRESLFVSLFRAVMVDRAHAILLSLMVYAGGLVWSLLGGLLYVCFTPSAERALPPELDEWSDEPADGGQAQR